MKNFLLEMISISSFDGNIALHATMVLHLYAFKFNSKLRQNYHWNYCGL